MTATQGDLASLSRYIFRAPRWYASVAFALLIAAVSGAAAFDAGFVLEDAWQGVFFIGVPTVVASLVTTPVDRWLGGQLTYNRSSLLAVTCEGLIVAIMAGAGVLAVLFARFDQKFVFDALIIGLAVVFALRLLIVMAVSGTSVFVAAVPASIQTVTAAVLVFVYSGTMQYLHVGGGPLVETFVRIVLSRAEEAPQELGAIVAVDFALLAIMCAIYGFAVWAFVRFIDRPWQRGLGVSVLDFLSGFIGHIAEGTTELEDFFEDIGEEAVVPVSVLAFRRKGAAEDSAASDRNRGDFDARGSDAGSEKARFVLPMIHPGPMGEIGGGNLPRRVALDADGLAFPPHATAGHDFNLVTEREVDALLETAREAHERIEYHDTATRSVRVREGDAKVVGQAFGDDALLVATYSPCFADDVEYAVGLSAAAEARSAGVEDVMLVDAHNCNNGLAGPDIGHVYPGSERSFQMMQAAGEAGEQLADAEQAPLRLGVAWDETEWGPLDGIGPLGVRVAVLEVGDHRTVYVLVDGNNMEPGLRDRIVERLTADESASADDRDGAATAGRDGAATADGGGPSVAVEAEVMTTDTHVVNQVEASNQVGEAIDDEELLAVVERLVADAADDLEPVEAGMASERAEVTVFGNDRTETLASHANAVISMGAALAATVILAAMAISLLVFFLAGA
jgi:putative membrane protein